MANKMYTKETRTGNTRQCREISKKIFLTLISSSFSFLTALGGDDEVEGVVLPIIEKFKSPLHKQKRHMKKIV